LTDALHAEGLQAAVACARAVRPALVEARAVLEGELVITPGMDDAVAQLQLALRALYALEVTEAARGLEVIARAMAALQRALAAVQDEISQHTSLQAAGERIARALAQLYPASLALAPARPAAPDASALRPSVERARGAWQSGRDATPAASLAQPAALDDEHDAIPLTPRRPPTQRPRRAAEFVPPAPDDERRYSRRVAIDVDIGLHSETNFFVGLAEDISDGGLFVATYDLLPIGTALTISMVLPGGRQLVIAGRVAWIRDLYDSEVSPGVGVRFEPLDPDDRRAIERFLSQRAPMLFET